MPDSEIYNAKFLIRIPEDHPDYEGRLSEILDLIRPCGLVSLEVFWPVGLPVSTRSEPEFDVRKRWDLGPLSEAFQRKARGRLLAEFEAPMGAKRALAYLKSEGIPYKRENEENDSKVPAPPPKQLSQVAKPAGRQVPPVIKSDAAPDPLWTKTLLKPPSEWLKYTLRNIAVLDSGCFTAHPTFRSSGKQQNSSRVFSFGGDVDYGGHGTFVSGQLVGRGGDGLPTNHGFLPKSSLWMGNVAVSQATDFAYPVDLGAYDLALNLLTMKGTPEYRVAGLHRFDVQVLNLSLGGPQFCEIEEDSIRAVYEAGISIVACVHNMPETMVGWEAPVYFPAALDTAVSVSAIDSSRAVWKRSRTGAVDGFQRHRLPMVDISAPGVGILSSLPGNTSGWRMGTSFAAPYVTAAMAVIRAANPKLTVDQATAVLMRQVLEDDYFKGGGYGAGILQCAALKMKSKSAT